jgi:excisionase family DNA binding protein
MTRTIEEQSAPVRTAEEAADQLRIHPVTMRRLLKARLIPAARIGGTWRISQTVIDDMLAGKSPLPTAPETPEVDLVKQELLEAAQASLIEHEAIHEVTLLNPTMRGAKEPAIIPRLRLAISKARTGKP